MPAPTPREREILLLISDGLTTKEISGRLGISPATVGAHRYNLMTKLNLHSVADVTNYAWLNGLRGPEKSSIIAT